MDEATTQRALWRWDDSIESEKVERFFEQEGKQ